jgi:hypothetical protein
MDENLWQHQVKLIREVIYLLYIIYMHRYIIYENLYRKSYTWRFAIQSTLSIQNSILNTQQSIINTQYSILISQLSTHTFLSYCSRILCKQLYRCIWMSIYWTKFWGLRKYITWISFNIMLYHMLNEISLTRKGLNVHFL